LTIKDFTPFEGICVRIVDQLEDDADHILISTNQRDKKVLMYIGLMFKLAHQP